MNINTKELSNKIAPIVQKIKDYISFIIILIILGLFGFIVLRIRSYAAKQPSQSAIDQKLTSLKQTRIDQEAIKQIQQLESTNVDVKALFDQARDNPFQE